MQERIEQLGGTMRITSDRGQGTTVEATVPLTHMLGPQKQKALVT
jgi:two-component system NarL family sensor kinase